VRRKTPKPTDRSRNSVGSELQTIGPATEKARWPNVVRRQRGTVSTGGVFNSQRINTDDIRLFHTSCCEPLGRYSLI